MVALGVLFGSLVFAQEAQAVQDKYLSDRPALWRSSRTNNAENFVLLATGAVHLPAIQIESATVNVESWVSVFNSSSTNTMMFSSTGTFLNTGVFGSNRFERDPILFDVSFGSGAVINKVGGAWVNIFWDFIHRIEKPHLIPYIP